MSYSVCPDSACYVTSLIYGCSYTYKVLMKKEHKTEYILNIFY